MAAAMMARTSIEPSAGPTPTAWLIRMFRDSCSCLDWVTTTSHSAPTPVFTPYARTPFETMDSTSRRAERMRPCASSDSASGTPAAMSATWRQESGRSRRMGGGMALAAISGTKGSGLGRRPRGPGFKVAAIALEYHAHIARTADGTRLAQGYSHPGDAELFQHEHGDVFGQGFDQMKLRSFDE